MRPPQVLALPRQRAGPYLARLTTRPTRTAVHPHLDQPRGTVRGERPPAGGKGSPQLARVAGGRTKPSDPTSSSRLARVASKGAMGELDRGSQSAARQEATDGHASCARTPLRHRRGKPLRRDRKASSHKRHAKLGRDMSAASTRPSLEQRLKRAAAQALRMWSHRSR